MHSVTSNAVANMLDKFAYNYYNPSNTPINVLDVIKTMPLGKTSVLRIGGITSGTPYGDNVNTDFYYVVFRLPERDDFIRVIAHSVRENNSFETALIANSWNNWFQIQPIVRFNDSTVITQGSATLEWSRADYRNGTVCLYARFVDYTTQKTFTDGETIGTLKDDYKPILGSVPTIVHNFANKQDYLLWIQADGQIKIYGIGVNGYTGYYDFYISVTYHL